MGESHYLRKFIIHVSTTTPLHSLTAIGKNFHWGKQQNRAFEYLKKKINNSLVLVMANFQEHFQLETDVIGYALGAVICEWICYHSKLFHGLVLDYPTYDKEIFVIVQEVEPLLTVKRHNYTHQSSTSCVSIEPGKDATSEAL
jgi:hypothetical protein